MKLTKQQVEVLPYVKWLFHGHRCTGRTTVIVAAAIQHAIEYPRMRVDLIDHYYKPGVRNNDYLIDTFKNLISEYPEKIQKRFKIYKAHGLQISYDPMAFVDYIDMKGDIM